MTYMLAGYPGHCLSRAICGQMSRVLKLFGIKDMSGPAAVVVISGKRGRGGGTLSVLLTARIVLVEHGLRGRGCELANCGAEGAQNGGGGRAPDDGEVVAVGAIDFVDQAVGPQQAKLAAGPA